jgi:hypothetical protein
MAASRSVGGIGFWRELRKEDDRVAIQIFGVCGALTVVRVARRGLLSVEVPPRPGPVDAPPRRAALSHAIWRHRSARSACADIGNSP